MTALVLAALTVAAPVDLDYVQVLVCRPSSRPRSRYLVCRVERWLDKARPGYLCGVPPSAPCVWANGETWVLLQRKDK